MTLLQTKLDIELFNSLVDARQKGDYESASEYYLQINSKLIDTKECDHEFNAFYFYLKNKNIYHPDKIHQTLYNLLNRNHYPDTALKNYVYYIRQLEGRRIKLSDLVAEYIFPFKIDEMFVMGSASIISDGDGYIANIRLSKDYMGPVGRYVRTPCEYDFGITKNICVKLTENWEITECKPVYDGVKIPLNEDNYLKTFVGIEDVLLYRQDNKIKYRGYINRLEGNVKRVVIQCGNYTNYKFSDSKTIKSPFNEHEKNWAPFGDGQWVYSWHPLRIGKIEEDTFVITDERKMSPFFKKIRGSSMGCNYEDEIWFIVHTVSFENTGRRYMHCLVIMDSCMNVKKISHVFNFEMKPVEYVLGLIVRKDDIIISYSVSDSSSNILIVPKKNIKYLNLYQ